jgi:hypothetical protein
MTPWEGGKRGQGRGNTEETQGFRMTPMHGGREVREDRGEGILKIRRDSG